MFWMHVDQNKKTKVNHKMCNVTPWCLSTLRYNLVPNIFLHVTLGCGAYPASPTWTVNPQLNIQWLSLTAYFLCNMHIGHVLFLQLVAVTEPGHWEHFVLSLPTPRPLFFQRNPSFSNWEGPAPKSFRCTLIGQNSHELIATGLAHYWVHYIRCESRPWTDDFLLF